MKTFNDYMGTEGIDKLMECVPYITEILSDKDTMKAVENKSWLEIGGMIYKAHTETCDKLLNALDSKPDKPIGIVSSIAKIFSELLTDRDMIDFFMSASKMKSTSATENTEGAQ